MKDYLSMDEAELRAELETVRGQYQGFCGMDLRLDMSRGKPCPEQLDLSQEMLRMVDNYTGEDGTDARNYGLLAGMPEARRFFADLLRLDDPEEVIVCGNSSLAMMYYLIDLGWRAGFVDSVRPWRFCNNIKFLCPVPGYDRHFLVTEYFGFQLVPVPMLPTGPDMDLVEQLVKNDETVKGMWCVPVYSNPDGYTYSDDTVKRLAAMQMLGINAPQQLLRLFQNMTIMSFVCRIQQFIMLAQHHALDGGATDVKTYSHLVFPPKDK